MTREEMEVFYDALVEDARGIMFAKSKDYARNENAFDNLERTGADLGLTREQVCMVYLNKHLDSIKGHVRGQDHTAAEPLRGRVCDAINYLVMLAGMKAQPKPCTASGCVRPDLSPGRPWLKED